MRSIVQTALTMAIGAIVAISVATLPTRAADNSKSLLDRVSDLEQQVKQLKKKLKYVHVESGSMNGLNGPHMIIEGCNLHVRSGSGDTQDTGGLTGRGNLIVGYNEQPPAVQYGRLGSHNVVIGRSHEYSSYGGFLAGYQNAATGPASSVSGGALNEASGGYSAVSGGNGNTASGTDSSVSGGVGNTASGFYSSVSGGNGNAAQGSSSTVSGGNGHASGGSYDWRAGALFQDE